MLCLTWLLGWEGLEEGAMGAGDTGRVLVSPNKLPAEVEHGTGLGDDSGCFLGMMNEVLLIFRAPVS